MNIFKSAKLLDRLNTMLDLAIKGEEIPDSFDEDRVSALETRFSHYLKANQLIKEQLVDEEQKIHQLISDISHQTKTPIANILLYGQLLEERNLPAEEEEMVRAVMMQAEKLNFLIAALLKSSRLESGLIALSPAKNPIQQIFDALYIDISPKAVEKNIALTIVPSDLWACFDRKWTIEAVGNILDNAIKYTPEGGTVQVSAKAYEFFCRIDILDNGMGIAEEEQGQIFQRFYRSPKTSHYAGVGIGLYLTREILRGMGGYLKVQSEVGKGSTFSVFLPMKDGFLSKL